MNDDFKHSTSFVERPGTVQFAIFHPYSSPKGCRDGMPEVTKRYESRLFQPRRKLTSQGSVNCIAIVQQSWPECERVLRIFLEQEPWMKQKGPILKNYPPEIFNN
jgi:hypothetical protein